MILSWSTIQFSEKPQTLYPYWTLSMSLQIIPLHMYSVCPHSFRYGGRYTLEILKGAFVWEYSGIRIYSGIGKFSFAKRTNIPDILAILMRLLSDTRKSQRIFWSLSSFSNEKRVSVISTFPQPAQDVRWSLDFLPPYSLLLAPKRFSSYNLHFWKASHAPCIGKLTEGCPL